MKKYRFGHIGLALIAASILAACGGGGGATVPSVPTPGGNGAAPPSSNPTSPPSSAPTASPTVSPTPTPTPTASPAPSTQTINTYPGAVFGTDNLFTPNDGDTSSGGQGQPVDGITCDATMSNNYHVHAYVGVYVNGQRVATPDAIGIVGAEEPSSGFINYGKCFYDIHTHDASGYVHFESADPTGVPITGALFTTKNLFDIWGIQVNAQQFGQFTGPMRVYTSGQVYRGGRTNGTFVSSSTYTQWTGDPNAIPIYSHEVIFFEVGPTYPVQLPNVNFYTEY
jgi:hypothetical protein